MCTVKESNCGAKGGWKGCMNVLARTIDEKRCEEWLGFLESLSARGTLQNEGRQVHRGCSWEAACSVVARYSDVLSSSLLVPRLFSLQLLLTLIRTLVPFLGAKCQDKAATGENIVPRPRKYLSFLIFSSSLFSFL